VKGHSGTDHRLLKKHKMDASQIRLLAARSDVIKQTFMGVFPKDGLASRFHGEIPKGSYVLNSDISGSSGRHWLGLYKATAGGNLLLFFDSFGRAPSHYGMSFPGHLTLYNDVAVQPRESISCGIYVLFFIYRKNLGDSLAEIISAFDWEHLFKNERTVNDFVTELLR